MKHQTDTSECYIQEVVVSYHAITHTFHSSQNLQDFKTHLIVGQDYTSKFHI